MNEDFRNELAFEEGSLEELLNHSLKLKDGAKPAVMVVLGGEGMLLHEKNRIIEHAQSKGIQVLFPTAEQARALNRGFDQRGKGDQDIDEALKEFIRQNPMSELFRSPMRQFDHTEIPMAECESEGRRTHMERAGFLGGRRGKGKSASFFNNGGKRGR